MPSFILTCQVPFARTEHNLLEIFESLCDNKMYTKPLSDLESDDAPDLPEESDESEAAPAVTASGIAATEPPVAAVAPSDTTADENATSSTASPTTIDAAPSDATSSTPTSTSTPEKESDKPVKKPNKRRNKRLRAMCHQMLEDHHDDFLHAFHKSQKQTKIRLCVEKVKGTGDHGLISTPPSALSVGT